MKRIYLFLLSTVFALGVFAQKEKIYGTVLYKEVKQENDLCEIKITDIVSTKEYIKFKIRVENRTGDFILIDPANFKFKINDMDISVKEKPFMVAPNDWNSKVINVLGPDLNKVKTFTAVLGGWSKCPTDGKTLVAEDLTLGSKSAFKAGPVAVNIAQFKKDTDKTDVKVNTANNGQGVCFVFPNRIAVLMPDNVEYVNATTKIKPIMLLKGESDNFWLHWDRMPGGKLTDMQKVQMVVKWHDAFVESTPVKVDPVNLSFEWDEALTISKN